MNYKDYITIEPNTRSGQPCIRGTRVTVKDVLEYLASGLTQEEILDDLPSLTREGIQACLAFAADRERELSDLAAVQIVPRQLDGNSAFAGGSSMNDSLTTEKLSSMQRSVGEIALVGGFWLPENWMLCNGAELPISLYRDLFSALGTKFGGNGQTSFRLPNLQNEAPKDLNYIICVVGCVPRGERIPEIGTETSVAELRRRLALLEAKLTELTSAMNFAIDIALRTYPGFQAVDSSDSDSILASVRYTSPARWDDVKSFYSTALIQQGWWLATVRSFDDWPEDSGERELTFRKGQYSVVIEYRGHKAIVRDWTYKIAIRWDDK